MLEEHDKEDNMMSNAEEAVPTCLFFISWVLKTDLIGFLKICSTIKDNE